MGYFFTGSIAMGEKKRALEEQHREDREGRIGGSKAKGRQSRRKAGEDTDKAKTLWCHFCIQKE